MDGEVTEQAQSTEPSGTKPEAKPEVKADETTGKKADKGYEMPKADFFQEGNLQKYAEEMNLFDDSVKSEVKEKKTEAKEKPCVDCGDNGDKKTTKKETRKPIDVLTVNGKEHPIYTEEERRELAQKGLYMTKERQKDSEWEKSLAEREDKFAKIQEPLTQLVDFLKGGQSNTEPGQSSPVDDLKYETMDPAIADELKAMRAELTALKGKNKMLESESLKSSVQNAKAELDKVLSKAREDFPFDEIIDKESGANKTQDVFAGLVSVKANRDVMKGREDKNFKPRSIGTLMQEVAKDMHALENHYKAKFGNNSEKPTASSIAESHPEIAEEIGQAAVATYLKNQEESSAPIATPARPDAVREEGKKEGFKGLSDGIKKGLKDPEIAEAFERAAQSGGRKFGLK